MTSSVLRIVAALFLLGAPAALASAPPAQPAEPVPLAQPYYPPEPEPDLTDIDPDLPDAVSVGLFCGEIARRQLSPAFSRVTYKDVVIVVDVSGEISVSENDVLLKKILPTEYSSFGDCLRVTLGAMREFGG